MSKFEVICSVAEEDDQAISVVKTLMERYPDTDASLLIGKYCLNFMNIAIAYRNQSCGDTRQVKKS